MAVENRVNIAGKVSACTEAHSSEYQGGVSHSPSGFYSFSHKLVFQVLLFFFKQVFITAVDHLHFGEELSRFRF